MGSKKAQIGDSARYLVGSQSSQSVGMCASLSSRPKRGGEKCKSQGPSVC